MKNSCKCTLREYLDRCFADARKRKDCAPPKAIEKLLTDASSKHGEGLCCTIAFIIFLCFYCKDINKFVSDLREIILRIYGDDSQDS